VDLSNDFDLDFERKVLFTKFDGREKSSHELLQKCIDSFEKLMMKNYIRSSSEVKNTIRSHRNLFQGKSPVKTDYDLITRELLDFN
jgi:chromosome partitioning protein